MEQSALLTMTITDQRRRRIYACLQATREHSNYSLGHKLVKTFKLRFNLLLNKTFLSDYRYSFLTFTFHSVVYSDAFEVDILTEFLPLHNPANRKIRLILGTPNFVAKQWYGILGFNVQLDTL